jgi:ATP-dependent helicase/DNAse subunit B
VRDFTVPSGDEAQQLLEKFEAFVQKIEAPAGSHNYHHFVAWLEGLIDLLVAEPPLEDSNSPQFIDNNLEDNAALKEFKDVLRGLVWSEIMLGQSDIVDFARFFQELEGAAEAASYRSMTPGVDRILIADAVQARGVPFEAVAVLGLAEGEFPATLTSDPFLRESDRMKLNRDASLSLESSIESAEREFFYETVTRAGQSLLLTRPRLTETGAEWQPSPFWEEIERLTRIEPKILTSESMPAPADAASWPELLESLASQQDNSSAWRWVEAENPTDKAAVVMASRLFTLRIQPATLSPFDGHLGGLAAVFGRHFSADTLWSASRLESYRACPFHFFVGEVLKLKPKIEPALGLEAWQLGNIYHLIFETLYSEATDPADTEALLTRLDVVANTILDRAPEEQGFRVTAWWQQSRQEIIEKVRQSILALAELPGDYQPTYFEQVFKEDQALTITDPDSQDYFQVRGIIDRIDTGPEGTLRVIDYKISGAYAFTPASLIKGSKLQLPLYALAASNALGLGTVTDGFYWHVLQTRASQLSLAGFDDGPEAAFDLCKQFAWEAVRGARAGQFVPSPPATGCPRFCPAASFCWHYQAGYS